MRAQQMLVMKMENTTDFMNENWKTAIPDTAVGFDLSNSSVLFGEIGSLQC